MSESDPNSFNGTEGSSNPWVEVDMDVRGETEKSDLADRIRNQMTLREINELDIKSLPEAEFNAVKERIKQYRETGNAGPIVTAAVEAVGTTEVASTPESELPPKVQETKEKVANHPGASKAVNKPAKRTLAKVVAGAVALSTVAGVVGYNIGTNLRSDAETSGSDEQIEQAEEAETEIGIKDGYGEKGMWLSENKPSELAFGSAVEVAEVCDGDECEMVKYTADNQVEAMASYMAHLPEQLQPDGFKGLSIAETEQKLESLSDEEYEKVQKEFNEAIDHAFTRNVEVSGQRANVLMDKKDASGDVNYGNMEAVKCTTNENSTMRQLFWTEDNNANGNEIGSMTVKIIVDDEGNIIGGCIQTIDELDSPVIKDLTEKEDTPGKGEVEQPETPTPPAPIPTPTPEPEPTPDTPHQPKNTEAEKKNAGTRVDQRDIDETVTPKTTEEQDKAPVKEAHEQVSSGNTAGSQTEKETQKAVDNSAQTKKNDQESTSHADDTASERAEAFENGDF